MSQVMFLLFTSQLSEKSQTCIVINLPLKIAKWEVELGEKKKLIVCFLCSSSAFQESKWDPTQNKDPDPENTQITEPKQGLPITSVVRLLF